MKKKEPFNPVYLKAELNSTKTFLIFDERSPSNYVEAMMDLVGDNIGPLKEKAFFDLLSRLENEHYLSLKDTDEYFIDSASWYRKLEHHGFDRE